MNDEEKADALGADLTNKLQEAMHAVYPGDMLTRWVVIAETIDGETSDRTLICSTGQDAKSWDTLGLLTFALEQERAAFRDRD